MARITKIEATPVLAAKKKTRVAAYARVSTSSDEQLLSLETQKEHYDNFINANPTGSTQAFITMRVSAAPRWRSVMDFWPF